MAFLYPKIRFVFKVLMSYTMRIQRDIFLYHLSFTIFYLANIYTRVAHWQRRFPYSSTHSNSPRCKLHYFKIWNFSCILWNTFHVVNKKNAIGYYAQWCLFHAFNNERTARTMYIMNWFVGLLLYANEGKPFMPAMVLPAKHKHSYTATIRVVVEDSLGSASFIEVQFQVRLSVFHLQRVKQITYCLHLTN